MPEDRAEAFGGVQGRPDRRGPGPGGNRPGCGGGAARPRPMRPVRSSSGRQQVGGAEAGAAPGAIDRRIQLDRRAELLLGRLEAGRATGRPRRSSRGPGPRRRAGPRASRRAWPWHRRAASRTVGSRPCRSASEPAWARIRFHSSTTSSDRMRSRTASRHFQVTPANPPMRNSRARAAVAATSGLRRHHIAARTGALDRPGQDRLAPQPSGEVLGEGQGAGIPAARLLLQALAADDVQVARHPGIQPRRRLGVLRPHHVERLDQRRAGERRPAGEQGVQDRPQAVDVRRRRDRAACRGSSARAPCTTACRSGCSNASARGRRRSAWPGRSR